jgi:hypothetical protein
MLVCTVICSILELTFAQQKDAEEQRGKLKDFKKEISVWDKYDASLGVYWHNQ